MSKVTDEQLKKVRILIDKLDTILKAKIEKENSSGKTFLTISIDEREVVKNFLKTISLLTSYQLPRVYSNSPITDIKVVKKGLNRLQFKLGIWLKMSEELRKRFFSNLPMRLISLPPQMNFKFIKYALCGSEYVLKDDEVKAGMKGERENKLEPFCIQKKVLFSREDIQFIHAMKGPYGTPYIAMSFNEDKNTEICNEIDQSPYKLIAFLVDEWIYAIFDSFDIDAINQDGERESISRSSSHFHNVQEIQMRHDSKTDIENVALLIKYGRFNIPLKPVKDSVRIEPTLLYKARILVYPIHWVVKPLTEFICFFRR